jgi:subtilisin family serine protease
MNRSRLALQAAPVALALLLAACAGNSGGPRPPPTDEVIDESAAEDAIAVLTGQAPGVAVIAEYPEGSDVDAVTDALRDDFALTVTSRYHDLVLGAAFIAPDPDTAAQLAADPRVRSVSPDRLVTTDSDAAAPDAELGEAFDLASASGETEITGGSAADRDDFYSERTIKDLTPQIQSTGWRLIRGGEAPGDGSGVLVAVLDSGVDYLHPDLIDAVHPTMGKDCVRRTDKDVMDRNGHGTHVSGIIAAQNNEFGTVGIAPRATIVPVRVLDARNDGTASSILCGLDYVARRTRRIDVVNMSIQSECGQPCEAIWPAAEIAAVRELVRRDVFVAACAGNNAADAEESFPGFIDEVVTVSNYVDFNGKISSTDRYKATSNFGPGVDIGGPGTAIMSTYIDDEERSVYIRMSGCSMATPFVAGAAAVYKQVYGGGQARIREMLLDDARTSYPGRGGDHPERLLLLRDASSGPGSGCGDGLCLGDETDASCSEDCGCAAVLDCRDLSPFGCYCDADCTANRDCCADVEAVCPAPSADSRRSVQPAGTAAPAAASASAMARAEAGRSAGSLPSADRMMLSIAGAMSRSGATTRGGAGSVSRCRLMRSRSVSATNGRRPAASSYRMTPIA